MEKCSDIVRDLIETRPFISDALAKGLINYSALARELLPEVKQRAKRSSLEAIMVAIRRYAEEPGSVTAEKITTILSKSSLGMKNDIARVNMTKGVSSHRAATELFKIIKFAEGEVLYIVEGSELNMIIDEKNVEPLKSLSKKEDLLDMHTGLSLIVLKHPEEGTQTPGFYYFILGFLAREGINIPSMVDTTKEVIFIVDKKDSVKAYSILQELIEKFRK